jgi:hypothetical protein
MGKHLQRNRSPPRTLARTDDLTCLRTYAHKQLPSERHHQWKTPHHEC